MIANNAETNAFIANVRLANTANKKLLKNVQGINALKRDHLMMKSLRKEDRKISKNGRNGRQPALLRSFGASKGILRGVLIIFMNNKNYSVKETGPPYEALAKYGGGDGS